MWLIPAIKADHMLEEPVLVLEPDGMHMDAPAPIVGVVLVSRVVTSASTGCQSIEQPPAVLIIGAGFSVLEETLTVRPALLLRADITPRGFSLVQIAEVHQVRIFSARALDQDHICEARAPLFSAELHDRKLAEPVSRAWQVMDALVASRRACVQVGPVLIK